MRAIHFCFQLHEAYRLGVNEDKVTFLGEEEFRSADKEIYQPLFALLERNTQKYKRFHFSLLVSGLWLEMAEEYDAELVRRLEKLVELGQVELIVTPYYYSTACFYSFDELEAQVRFYQEKIDRLFGTAGRIFALPEFLYNDTVAKWAEEMGFAGMLAGGSAQTLGWHSANHVYEVEGCEYLRVLFQNQPLNELLVGGELLVEQKVDEDGKEVVRQALSEQKFQKQLELDMLRGPLVNLYFDAKILRDLRDVGVIGFFDHLISNWLEHSGNRLVGAAEACMLETPTEALSVTNVVSWRGDEAEKDVDEREEKVQFRGFLPVLASESMRLPDWLSADAQKTAADELYDLRREILASEDEKLIVDFRRMTALDYQAGMREDGLDDWRKMLGGLKARANEAKKSQAVEISRAYTKKRDRGIVDNSVAVNFVRKPVVKTAVNEVKVNFGARGGVVGASVHAGQKHTDAVPVRRLPNMRAVETAAMGEIVDLPRQDDVEIQLPEIAVEKKTKEVEKKPRGARRIIKRLVIE